MRVLGLALAATLVGGAMFGVRQLVVRHGGASASAPTGAGRTGARVRGARGTPRPGGGRGPGALGSLVRRLGDASPGGGGVDGVGDDDVAFDVANDDVADDDVADDDVVGEDDVEGDDLGDDDDLSDGGVELMDDEPAGCCLGGAADDSDCDPCAEEEPGVHVMGYVTGKGELGAVTVTLDHGGEMIDRWTTEPDGAFAIDLDASDVASGGPFVLRAMSDDGWSGMIEVASLSGLIRVPLSTRLGGIAGVVVDGAGRPLTGVDVEAVGLVSDSTDLDGAFSLDLPVGQRTTLRFVSFGLEIARTDVVPRARGVDDAPLLRVVARVGRSVTCPLERLGREVAARSMSFRIESTGGVGWGYGRGWSHGVMVTDLTVIPGPAMGTLTAELDGAGSVTATIRHDRATCDVGPVRMDR